MDFNSMKEVVTTSLNSCMLLIILPALGIPMISSLEFGRDNVKALLGKRYLDDSGPVLVLMNLVVLIILSVALSPRFIINDNVKISVPIKLSQTEYTDRVINKITDYYESGEYKGDDRYIKIDGKGNMEFVMIEDKKSLEDFDKDGKQRYIQNQYKKELSGILEEVMIENRRSKNDYGNLSEEEKREAIELYNQWKENKNTKTELDKAQKDANASRRLNDATTAQSIIDINNN